MGDQEIPELFFFGVVVKIVRIGSMEVFQNKGSEEVESSVNVGVVRLVCPDRELVVEAPDDIMVIDDPIHDCLIGSSGKSLIDPIRCATVEIRGKKTSLIETSMSIFRWSTNGWNSIFVPSE